LSSVVVVRGDVQRGARPALRDQITEVLGRTGPERIVVIVDPAHVVSQRVLDKIGMWLLGPEHLLGRIWLVYEANR